ncbi:MAG: type II secretion system F family protein [Bacteroidia bacterium]|nr:type II secretion system F family protein [Bacteroidia bacterium]
MEIRLDEIKRTARVNAVAQEKTESSGILSLLNKDISFGGNSFNEQKKEKLYSDIELLLNAGLDLSVIFDLLIDECKNKKEKEIYESVKKDLVKGKSFSNSLQDKKHFSKYEYISIRMGEESGKLNLVCKELARYFSGKIRQKKQIKGALVYPSLVMGTALLVLTFMLKYVVPMFVQIFNQNKVELPYITKVIIKISENFSVVLYSAFFIIVAFTAIRLWQGKKDWYRKLAAKLLLKTPFFGPLYHRIYLARLCYSMQLLLSSKAMLTDAIDLVTQMVGFFPFEESLKKIRSEIVKGKSFHQSISQFNVYPGRMVSLLKVGEEVNQLENVFGKLGAQFADEAELKTKSLNSVLEPVLILFIGAVVGFILIAMYIPMFKIGDAIG